MNIRQIATLMGCFPEALLRMWLRNMTHSLIN